MLRIKPGVRMKGISNEITAILPVVAGVYQEFSNSQNCVITSVTDGRHKTGSDHYCGNGIDFRIWGFSHEKAKKVSQAIRSRLTGEYFVLLEKDHIHISYRG